MSEEAPEAAAEEGTTRTLTKDQSDFLQAAGSGRKGTMESLLASGSVDVNVCSATKGVTALMAAVGQGHVECVAYLLEQKADVTIVTTGDQFTKGMIALHLATNLESAEIAGKLVDAKPDTVNTADEDGNTPLHLAAYASNKAIVEALLAKGADKELKTGEGATAKDEAEKQGHGEVAALL